MNIFDKIVFQFFHHTIRCYALDLIMPYVTLLGYLFSAVLILVIVFIFSKPDNKRYALGGLITIFASEFIVNVLKAVVKRPRPYETEYAGRIIGLAKSFSFPSGHATIAFVLACILGIVYPKIRWIFFSAATAVAISRVYMGLHYPSDVLAGALLGCGAVYLAAGLLKRRPNLLRP
jgi:undecaprenyl-diphosphatase